MEAVLNIESNVEVQSSASGKSSKKDLLKQGVPVFKALVNVEV